MRAIGCRALFVLAFFAAGFFSERLVAQVGTGTSSGVVMDSSGAVLAWPAGQVLFSGIDPNGNGIPNPTAGQITNTVSTARQIQFALTLRF
jgi:hypothetical protein